MTTEPMTAAGPDAGLVPTPPSPSQSADRHARVVLACVSVCTVLVVGFVASINLAVPLLAASRLHPSAAELLWIVDAYVVLFACLVIPAGAAGDRYGRKGLLLVGLGLFAAGAAVSAAAPDVAVMLTGRVVTGVGAACVLPNCLALLIHATPPARRSAAIAVWAAMSGIGGAVGNIGGGALLTTGSWRWLFVAVVPIALGCAAWVAVAAPRTDRHDRPLSPRAAALLTAATLALLLGIIEGPERGWGNPLVVTGFVASAVLLAVWVLSELRARHPMLDPRLFRIPLLRGACIGMLTMFFGSYGLFYLNASLLQYGRGYTALQAGLGVVPLTLPLLLGGRRVPHLVARIGVTPTVAAAFVLASLGLYGLGSSTRSAYPVYAVWLVVFGVGFALALPSLTAEITAAMPREQAGVGAGLQATTRELGSALGVAVVGSLLTSRFVATLPAAARNAHPAPRTVPTALAAVPGQRTAVLQAFTHGATGALHLTSLVLLAAGLLVVAQTSRQARPTAPA
jgi:predicted MFS family arabinose efflux permease